VAGPGDSLANEETFKFFEKLAEEQPDLIKCMSTNGLLLPKYADKLAELGVNSVTVTINAIDPDIAKDIYSFIKYEGKVYKGREAVEILIKNQLEGVEKAAANGLVVKVNSVLIPGLNDEHIVEIAKEVKKRGASLMNILPLIPLAKMKKPKITFAITNKALPLPPAVIRSPQGNAPLPMPPAAPGRSTWFRASPMHTTTPSPLFSSQAKLTPMSATKETKAYAKMHSKKPRRWIFVNPSQNLQKKSSIQAKFLPL
jgi:MoaA/NifB/PqqE/SkfB family radical SAM enzyme